MSSDQNTANRDYLGKALDIAIRLAVIGVIVLSAVRIVNPFIVPVVWGIIIAVALFPLFEKFRKLVGGSTKLAGTLFILLTLAAVLTPTIILTESLIDGAVGIVKKFESGTIDIPPPSESVKDWPLIGERTYATWKNASVDMQATAAKLGPQLVKTGERLAGAFAGLGGAVIQTIIALIIAGILMMTSEGGARTAHSIAKRLAGTEGPEMVDLASGTIRSVVKGVILVALIQGLLSAVGLAIAGVPGVGLWSLLVVVVAIIQLPPILILGPIAIWVFANASTGIAIFFLIWSLVISGSDGFLKPLFLGRGVQVPMLVILIGAIGGMLGSGVVGLFIGPVILAIAYQLFLAWVRDDDATSVKPESAG